MSKKPETVFKEKVLKDLKTVPYSYWDKIQQVAKRGTPDIYGCIGGAFVAIELKKDDKTQPDPLQWHNLVTISQCGGLAMLTYPENWENTFSFLMKIGQKVQAKTESAELAQIPITPNPH